MPKAHLVKFPKEGTGNLHPAGILFTQSKLKHKGIGYTIVLKVGRYQVITHDILAGSRVFKFSCYLMLLPGSRDNGIIKNKYSILMMLNKPWGNSVYHCFLEVV